MTTLYVGNSFNETLVGDLRVFDPAERRIGGNLSCRLVWLMEPGDVLVSPQPISADFLGYVAEFTGVAVTPSDVVVPPPGAFGLDVLSADRLRGAAFLKDLVGRRAERGLDRIVPYCYDETIASIARHAAIGASDPSVAFCEAGGVELLNRKTVFRSLCGGSRIPIPEGVATRSIDVAIDFVCDLIGDGRSVIVKQDAHQGGHGNEILAATNEVRQLGAAVLTVVEHRSDVVERLQAIWSVFSSSGRDAIVIEHYLEDSVSLGCEIQVGDVSATLRHTAEMQMTPVFDGLLIPPGSVSGGADAMFARQAITLAEVVRAMGYRGLINVDGLVAGNDEHVVLNEFNGRLGGSTHLHRIGELLLGERFLVDRYLMSNNDLKVASFPAVLARLRGAGLAFDPERGEGVILTCDHTEQSGAVEYCVIAGDIETARGTERQIRSLSGEPA
jgi:hypothetical protein